MHQPSLDFDGATFAAARDGERLSRQLDAVRRYMRSGEWRTLDEIAAATGAPPASVSARLRDLRKPRFGGMTVERKPAARGLWLYRVREGR